MARNPALQHGLYQLQISLTRSPNRAAADAAKANSVMPGLVPGIHVCCCTAGKKDVDGRVKPA